MIYSACFFFILVSWNRIVLCISNRNRYGSRKNIGSISAILNQSCIPLHSIECEVAISFSGMERNLTAWLAEHSFRLGVRVEIV
jgi:hypothetical protein